VCLLVACTLTILLVAYAGLDCLLRRSPAQGELRAAFLAALSDEHRMQMRLLPRFTPQGFWATKLAPHLRAALAEEFRLRRKAAQREADPALVFFSSEMQRPVMTWLTGSQAETSTRAWLQTELCRWSKLQSLEHQVTYGVRTYKRGTTLKPHTDRFMTHVISAIVHVASEGLRADWALQLLPHDASHVQEVFLGGDVDCLFYESAVVPHSRLKPLDGDEYSNLFFHFSPAGWQQIATQRMTDGHATT